MCIRAAEVFGIRRPGSEKIDKFLEFRRKSIRIQRRVDTFLFGSPGSCYEAFNQNEPLPFSIQFKQLRFGMALGTFDIRTNGRINI